MSDLIMIKKKIADMAGCALKMWRTTHQAFIEHDTDLVAVVLKDENTLNDLEKEITKDLVAFGRETSDARAKQQMPAYTNIVGDLELIGDYCKDILERVEIKITERLLFSDEAFQDYEELYRATDSALDEVVCVIARDSLSLVKDILKNGGHIDTLVDRLRLRHDQRLLSGICSPLAGNMYLNMLDFTAAVYYHAKKIGRNLAAIKQ
jgi:phosphate:Na+ symporter